MNNELQRQERKASDHRAMRGQAVLRNNDLANRQSSKDVLQVKNRTVDQPGKRQPEPRSGLSSTSYKAPAVKSIEDGLSQKKMNTGARSKPAAELTKLVVYDKVTALLDRNPVKQV
ncbi:hypothetical protein OS493_021297 [Desmophyllum pertusum]|uniref:Uncharacterized protein n=1 Tax=Desmophyllum pertusum TaxID=174260 RepID=A0A9W9ZCA7_9CNID|nr:hypothetical protein OS493_021297 [Desmophyllum pertusum]